MQKFLQDKTIFSIPLILYCKYHNLFKQKNNNTNKLLNYFFDIFCKRCKSIHNSSFSLSPWSRPSIYVDICQAVYHPPMLLSIYSSISLSIGSPVHPPTSCLVYTAIVLPVHQSNCPAISPSINPYISHLSILPYVDFHQYYFCVKWPEILPAYYFTFFSVFVLLVSHCIQQLVL